MATGSLAFIADYDDDDTEPDDETNADWNIKGTHLRGRFTISQDGQCPRCGTSNVVFVVLDELFPMGDMPDILVTLIAKGKAVLWSSQSKKGCKAPPTFLCRGFCPPDPLGAGFNVNWGNVSLQDLFFSSKQDDKTVGSTDQQGESNEDDENSSEEDDELDEEELIKQMLEKEAQKIQEHEEDAEDKPHDENDTNDSKQQSTKSQEIPDHLRTTHTVYSTAAYTGHERSTSSTSVHPVAETHEKSSLYPVSSDGFCPHCYSRNVKYIIVFDEGMKDNELPYTLRELLKRDQAFKMAKGPNEPPSFQCQVCHYGFNLDWSTTNLELIFGIAKGGATLQPEANTPRLPPPSVPPRHPPPFPPPGVRPPGMGMPPPQIPPPRPPPPVVIRPPPRAAMIPPRVPPPGIPPTAGMPPPRIPPPGTPPSPGMPPTAGMPPPRIPPPGTPPSPGMVPPEMPPPRIPPPGIPPTRVPLHGSYPPVPYATPHRVPPPMYGPPRVPPPRVPYHRYPPPGPVPPYGGVPPPRYPPPPGYQPYHRPPGPPMYPRYPAYGYPHYPPAMPPQPYGQHHYPHHPHPPPYPPYAEHYPPTSVPAPPGTQPTRPYKPPTYEQPTESSVTTSTVTTPTTSDDTPGTNETSYVDEEQSLQDKQKLDELLNQIDRNRGVTADQDEDMSGEEPNLFSEEQAEVECDDQPPGDDVMHLEGLEQPEPYQENVSAKDSAAIHEESDPNESQVVKANQSVTDSAEQNTSKNEENDIFKADKVATSETDGSNSGVDVESAVTPKTRRGRKRKAAPLKTQEGSQDNDEETKHHKVDSSLDDSQDEPTLEVDIKTTVKRGRRGRKPRGGKAAVSTRKDAVVESPSCEVTMSSPTNETLQDENMTSPDVSTEQYDSAADSSSGHKLLIDNDKNSTITKEEQDQQDVETNPDKTMDLAEEPEQPLKRKPRGRSRRSSDKDVQLTIDAEKSHPEDKMEQDSIGKTELPEEEPSMNAAQQSGNETESGIDSSKQETKPGRKRRGRPSLKGKTDDQQLEPQTSQPSNEDTDTVNTVKRGGRTQKGVTGNATSPNDNQTSEGEIKSNEQTETHTTRKRRGRSQEALDEKPATDTELKEDDTVEESNDTADTVKRKGRSAQRGNTNKASKTTDEHLSEGESEAMESSREPISTGKRKGRQKKVLMSPTSDEPKIITTTDEDEITEQSSRSTRGTVKNQTKPTTAGKRITRGRKISDVDNEEEPTNIGEESSDNNVKRTRRSLSNPSDASPLANSELSSETESNKTPKAASRGRSLRKRN
ncbi:apical junction molecule isoform X2 [Exaiptasia diaphana]|uniref:Uncharacterized protein n=1 Tax=Exaiptasia diaphana TaxID=2652724 RepID=A0A913YPG3_EXADI|nr:apical junction molecule isoform X2 [Exaiptasia diaphana]